jgi:hypothetical protein
MIVRKNSKIILEILREEIFSTKIILEFRTEKKYFTRNRKQPFAGMLLFMINMLTKSLTIEIDSFVTFLNSKMDSNPIKDFTKSAFVQKRMKINPKVFNYLSNVITENYYVKSNINVKLFYGFRILAVDGSKITLPFINALKIIYGETKNQSNTSVVQAITSVLYDVLNRIAIDSVLENVNVSERVLALRHKSHWKKNDLIIYDRGYPSYDFIFEHVTSDINYLMRTKKDHSKVVKSFVCSGKRTQNVEIFPREKLSLEGKNYSKNTPIKVRLIRVELPNNEVEVLITSLLDSQKYPASMFKEFTF